MAAKRGRLSVDEREYIIVNAAKLTPEEMAVKLNRTADCVRQYIQSRGITGFTTTAEQGRAEGMAIKMDLHVTQKWERLKEELTQKELLFFEEEYLKLMGQFRGDVLHSEETQVFDVIKYEILKSRNMVERRKARDDISRLEKVQQEFLDRFDEPSDMSESQRVYALNLETQLQAARSAEQSRTSEYVKLQERQDALNKSLKSTRDQRIREIQTGKETVFGLIKQLQRKEVQAVEGRQMELMRLAANREYNRLGQLHQFENGEADRPILSPETVDLGAEEENDDAENA